MYGGCCVCNGHISTTSAVLKVRHGDEAEPHTAAKSLLLTNPQHEWEYWQSSFQCLMTRPDQCIFGSVFQQPRLRKAP
jgi:hypothetical protein